MQNKTLALLLGGVVPAFLFGISGVLQKTSNRAGIGTGPYLIFAGLAVLITGVIFAAVQQDLTLNRASALQTCLFGGLWALGSAAIACSLGRYGGQISQLVPLYNMNTLVAVVVGLVMLSEWRTVDLTRLGMATVLTIAGGVLAATSSK